MYNILIDIDGTIGDRNRPKLLQIANKTLKLGIDEARLAKVKLAEFYALPEVVAHKARVGEAHFRYQMSWIELAPGHLAALKVVPGAHEAVNALAEHATIAYYTARYVPALPKLQAEIARATEAWLQNNGFPRHQSTVYCNGPADKLRRSAELIRITSRPVILIDDLYSVLLSKLSELDSADRAVLQAALTLCAFRVQDVPVCSAISLVTLPDWRQRDALERLIND